MPGTKAASHGTSRGWLAVCGMVATAGCSDAATSRPSLPQAPIAGNAGAPAESGGEGGVGGTRPLGLRDAATRAGRLLGTAVDANALRNDATYAEILAREFAYVTPENATKWGPLAPTATSYTWTDADAIVEFAEAHAQSVKGHVLVWHQQTPAWVNDAMTAEELGAALKHHIETTLGHYQGRMRAWDVVNEAIDTNTVSGYTESIFWQKLGPSYIEDAFRWARAADPNALLFYNDFAIERLGAKSDRVYAVLQDLLSRGVPIDGIGFQSHLSTHSYPAESDVRANFRRFAALGLSVNVSEFDARTLRAGGDQATRWQAERVAFQQVVGVCATEPGCEAITLWGLADQYSWINLEAVPDDPLLFDRTYAKKPAYAGVLAGLSGSLPTRGENLIEEGDFAAGGAGWSPFGGELSVGLALDRAGQAACVSGPTDTSHGLRQSLLAKLGAGGQLSFSSWVRLVGAYTDPTVRASLAIQDEGVPARTITLASVRATDTAYVQLYSDGGLGIAGTPLAIDLEIFGQSADVPGVDFCVTEVELRPVSTP